MTALSESIGCSFKQIGFPRLQSLEFYQSNLLYSIVNAKMKYLLEPAHGLK